MIYYSVLGLILSIPPSTSLAAVSRDVHMNTSSRIQILVIFQQNGFYKIPKNGNVNMNSVYYYSVYLHRSFFSEGAIFLCSTFSLFLIFLVLFSPSLYSLKCSDPTFPENCSIDPFHIKTQLRELRYFSDITLRLSQLGR